MAKTERIPPKAGARPSVRVDEQFAEDIAVLMSTGDAFSDAVRDAVNVLAVIYRNAWEAGACPPGTAPHILSANIAPAGEQPASDDAAA